MGFENIVAISVGEKRMGFKDDLFDAIEYINEILADQYSINDFAISSVTIISPHDYGDLSSWLEVECGEFVKDPRSLEKFRGKEWARRAASWKRIEDIPPIIIVDIPGLIIDIADGRGRVNYAIGMGFSTIPAIFLKG